MNYDCLFTIFDYLLPVDLLKCFSICQQYNIVAKKDYYWKKFAATDFPEKHKYNIDFFDKLPYSQYHIKYKHYCILYKFIFKHKPLSSRFPNSVITHFKSNDKQIAVIPTDINLLSDLTCFDISGNLINITPSQLYKMSNLTVLNLSHNNIDILSPDIGLLTNLVVLYLNNNKLKTIPSTIGSLAKLETLKLELNPLKSLPEDLNMLKKLCEFTIDRSKIGLIPAKVTIPIIDYLRMDTSLVTENYYSRINKFAN